MLEGPAENMQGVHHGPGKLGGWIRPQAMAWPVWVCPLDVCKCYSDKGKTKLWGLLFLTAGAIPNHL